MGPAVFTRKITSTQFQVCTSHCAGNRRLLQSTQADMPAASQVFAIVELAEMILDQLGTRDLLLLRRVDKNMRNMIEGSTILRRRIFFLAPVPHLPAVPQKNPVLYSLERILDDLIRQGSQRSAFPRMPDHWTDPEALWQHMFVSQPCTSRSFSVHIGEQMIARDVVEDKKGLKLKHICNLLEKNASARGRAKRTIRTLTKGRQSSRLSIRIDGDEDWEEVS